MGINTIGKDLQDVMERKNLSQVEVANGTCRSKQTMNGYYKDGPAPLDAVKDIADFANDSLFSQKMSFKVFNQIPPMQSDVYQDSPHTLDMIELYESEERQIRKNKAMMALAKNPTAVTEDDREAIVDYALNYLDEVFVETRCIEAIFGRINMSIMDGIKMRTPYWKKQKYMRGE